MKRKYVSLLLVICITSWGGCAASTSSDNQHATQKETKKMAETNPTPARETPGSYTKDMRELRAAFNHDKGKVRLVVLLSPT
ncbi:MAG: hypothetical protein H0W76_02795 [Pyrinomonadaceae bacterium]|nr:hypothetical protein [Pyrinomonadaceae bacterium]